MDDVWNLLQEYDFLSNNSINTDLVCILCEKILTNPRVGPCGCRFCKICIENYLESGRNICPGSTNECKEEYLNLMENINIDHFLNRKISKLILICPIESCTFSDQIINMKQHLIVCRQNAIECPLLKNGCNFISLSEDNVDKHYKMSKDKHLKLVLLKIVNMENMIDSINKNRKELHQKNEKLQMENDKLQTENYKYNDLLKQNQEISYQINNIKLEIQTLKTLNEKLKTENDKYNDLLKQNQEISSQINNIKLEIQTLKTLNEKLKTENNNDKMKINQLRSSYNQLKGQNDIQSKQIDDWKTKYENDINKNNLIKYLSECLIGNKTEFVWKIDFFSKIKSKRKSITFFIFKEDLRMELSMEYSPYGCKYSLCWNVSHHNDLLNSSCPFTFDFIIGIVHETSGNFIVSFAEKKAFSSSGIFFKKDIPESQIEKEIVNDCLTVKCLIRLSL